ncbi:MAG: SsrA-binding protein SmpB [bacterium]|nr:SsrA-binding protein SmpB [bacterium]
MPKKKRKSNSSSIQNRRARFDYELSDSLTVGIALNGRETKSLRLGRGQLQGAYVTVKNGELWLINAQIHGTNGILIDETEKTQARKLLAKRREIDALIAAKQQGRTIVPTEILTKTRFIKLRISLGKGKKNYDKRQVLKKRDSDRDVRRNFVS